MECVEPWQYVPFISSRSSQLQMAAAQVLPAGYSALAREERGLPMLPRSSSVTCRERAWPACQRLRSHDMAHMHRHCCSDTRLPPAPWIGAAQQHRKTVECLVNNNKARGTYQWIPHLLPLAQPSRAQQKMQPMGTAKLMPNAMGRLRMRARGPVRGSAGMPAAARVCRGDGLEAQDGLGQDG